MFWGVFRGSGLVFTRTYRSEDAAACDKPRYADLVERTERLYWHAAAEADARYIPLVTAGWDKRPRQDHRVPWEKDAAYHAQSVFPAPPTPAELAAHLRDAIAFVRRHPRVCEANALILYAWNEYDEGGWIAPTRGPDGAPNTDRLDALAGVLKPTAPADGEAGGVGE
ncbi:MAG: hypothetical protein ACOC7R_02450 [Planctomycetota bacterium]